MLLYPLNEDDLLYSDLSCFWVVIALIFSKLFQVYQDHLIPFS
ncbi:hypothetical protein LEP1GSC074_3036 [Leptospira noguchii str. Hook]|nr:hypothetical protein LEP1GSC074_3036 [Leptospira noguchii str. Hook]